MSLSLHQTVDVVPLSRFMGSRSHPHRVLSVCVSRCLWVCVIEANSLQLRVITIGLYQFLSRSPSCQILAVFAVVVYSPFWFRDSWALLLPGLRSPDLWLPIASLRYPPLPYGKLRFCLRKAPPLPYGKLRFCLRKAPPLPMKSSTLVSRCVLLLVINSLFRNWILPSSLWQKDLTNLHGFSGDSWFARTDIRQQRSYGSPGGEYVEHRTSCAGVSGAGVRAHNPGTVTKITRCATHTA